MLNAFITGVAGEALTADETAFLGDARPCGLILFSRNCRDHDQIRALVRGVEDVVGAPLLVLIDQEGGRVQRLRPPLGRALPPAAAYASLYERESERSLASAFLAARLVAQDLRALGINTNCAPVVDVPVAGSHAIIGDRAYGATPQQVVALARSVAKGLMAGGVVPVMKHIPGHGRATADSHLDLPVVTVSRAELSATDFAPFKALADLPAAMTAHVVFTALDSTEPASTSPLVTREAIRGEIGFDGLLMSDDLSMKALAGPMRARAEKVFRAGSDLALHCNGDIGEMREVAAGTPPLAGRARERFDRAVTIFASHAKDEPFDVAEAEAVLAEALAIGSRRTESV